MRDGIDVDVVAEVREAATGVVSILDGATFALADPRRQRQPAYRDDERWKQ